MIVSVCFLTVGKMIFGVCSYSKHYHFPPIRTVFSKGNKPTVFLLSVDEKIKGPHVGTIFLAGCSDPQNYFTIKIQATASLNRFFQNDDSLDCSEICG